MQKQQDPSLDDSEESDSEDDDDNSSENEDEDSDDPTTQLIKASRQEAADRARAERKTRKHAAKSDLEEKAKKRRKNEVNLNGLSSLSGRQERAVPVPPNVSCFICGSNHFKKDCPQRKRGYQGGDDGPPRKAPKSR